MRVVIDTNVFVSGYFWRGPPNQILKQWTKNQFKLIITDEIMIEYQDILSRVAKKTNTKNIDELIQLIATYGELVIPITLPTQVSRDPDDDRFLAAAVAAKAYAIISGDQDLLVLNEYQSIPIMNARSFLLLTEKTDEPLETIS